MTLYDWLMSAAGMILALFSLRIGFSFIYDSPIVRREWKKLPGKILEENREGFTIEYGDRTCSHIYTGTKDAFFATMGYSPEAPVNPSIVIWVEKQKLLLNDLLDKGYNRDYFFRFSVGKKLYVWTDPENTGSVYKIWSDDKPERYSAGRAFITIGVIILFLVLLTIKTKAGSL